MSDVLSEQQGSILFITFNRVNKHNAFDDQVLLDLLTHLQAAEENATVNVIILKANGRHFCAGADIAWMQRMADFSEAENIADAQILARVMYQLHHSAKPTLAVVHGAAMGGGAGIVAACDIAIAADTARFCFSEVKLGLIPAVISPYVIKAIGERAARGLFISAETFDAKRAHDLQLIQHCVPESELLKVSLELAQQIASWPAQAVRAAKSLVHQVASLPIDEQVLQLTATLIAKQRGSIEGQRGMRAFLDKDK